MKKKFFLVIFSLVLSFIIVEILLSKFYPQERSDSWRTQGSNGVYFNISNSVAKHEFFGLTDKVSVQYTFGKYHNRILPKNKSFSDRKILLMGDSFIFGWLAEDEYTIQNELQNYFKNFEVINSSAGGFSDADQFVYLREFCNLIKPEYVIFFTEIDRNFRSKIFTLDSKDNLVEGNNENNLLKAKLNKSKIYYYINSKFHSFQLIKKLYLNYNLNTKINYLKKIDYLNQKENNFSKKNNLIKLIYHKIYEETQKCGSKILFINIYWFKNNSDVKNYVYQNFDKLFNDSEDINYLTIKEEIKILTNNKKKFFFEEGHPNHNGTFLISQILIEKIKKLNFLN